MQLHRLDQEVVELFLDLALAQRQFLPVIERPVPLDSHLAISIDEVAGGGQFLYAREQRHPVRDKSQRHVMPERLEVNLPLDKAALQNTLYLGSESEAFITVMEEDWFLSEVVSREHQCLCFAVPQSEAKHPSQLLHAVRPNVLIEMENDLHVRARFEDVSAPNQLLPQGWGVVNFTVTDEGNRAVLVGHRLVTGGDVNDAQAPLPEGNVAFGPETILVRAAVSHHLRHSLHDVETCTLVCDESCNSTHESSQSGGK